MKNANVRPVAWFLTTYMTREVAIMFCRTSLVQDYFTVIN
jgi:hypothetical protein